MEKNKQQPNNASTPGFNQKSSKLEEHKHHGDRVDTGSSDSSIPERATDKHTESSPKPKK